MKKITLFKVLGFAAILIAGCNPIYVDQDYDPSVDFSRYKTFSWMEVPAADPENARYRSYLANALWRAGSRDQALAEHAEAARLDPRLRTQSIQSLGMPLAYTYRGHGPDGQTT